MAAYASQIVPYLLKAQRSPAVVDNLGTDVMLSSKETYNLNVELLILLSMVMKAIQDIHPTLATDQAWIDRLAHALDTGPNGDISGWPGWIVLQVPPERLGTYGGLETDTVEQLAAKIQAHNDGRPGHGQ